MKFSSFHRWEICLEKSACNTTISSKNLEASKYGYDSRDSFPQNKTGDNLSMVERGMTYAEAAQKRA